MTYRGEDVPVGRWGRLREVEHETWSHIIGMEPAGQWRCISGKDGDRKEDKWTGVQIERGKTVASRLMQEPIQHLCPGPSLIHPLLLPSTRSLALVMQHTSPKPAPAEHTPD